MYHKNIREASRSAKRAGREVRRKARVGADGSSRGGAGGGYQIALNRYCPYGGQLAHSYNPPQGRPRAFALTADELNKLFNLQSPVNEAAKSIGVVYNVYCCWSG